MKILYLHEQYRLNLPAETAVAASVSGFGPSASTSGATAATGAIKEVLQQ